MKPLVLQNGQLAEASVSLDPVAEWSQIPTNGLTTANSGGSSTDGIFKLELTCWTVGGFASGNANTNWSRNTAVGTVDFANAPTIRLTLAVGNVTTSATIRALMGRTNYTSSAALGEKGYGFEVRTGRLWLVTHDGTALTQSDTGVSLTANTTYVFVFGISEGTLYLRANGVAFSCSGAPTTGTTSYTYLQLSHLSAQATSCTSTWSDLHYSNGVSSALAAGATVGEPPLGNPTSDGMLLSSTAAGARSWVTPPSGGGGWVGSFATVATLAAGNHPIGSLGAVTQFPNTVFIALASPTTTPSNWGMVGLTPTFGNELLRFPDGDYVSTTLGKTSGTNRGTFGFVDRSDTYGYASGYRAVYVNGVSATISLRHSSFICYLAPFTGNNLDWAWRKISRGDGTWDIMNPYSDYYLGWDTATSQLRIVPSGDSRRVAWTMEPA